LYCKVTALVGVMKAPFYVLKGLDLAVNYDTLLCGIRSLNVKYGYDYCIRDIMVLYNTVYPLI